MITGCPECRIFYDANVQTSFCPHDFFPLEDKRMEAFRLDAIRQAEAELQAKAEVAMKARAAAGAQRSDEIVARYAKQYPTEPVEGVVYAEFWIDEAGEGHFLCHTKDDDFEKTRGAFFVFVKLLLEQLENETMCPLFPNKEE